MRILVGFLAVLAGVAVPVQANGSVFEVPLACEGEYTVEQTWTTTFDLGLGFTEISNIYIDWSGSITAELREDMSTGYIYAADAMFRADLYDLDTHDFCGGSYVQKGAATYPIPQPFDLHSTFSGRGWSMLLDGKGTIRIGLGRTIWIGTETMLEEPEGQLVSATLVFEGTPNPLKLSEPNGGESLVANSVYTIAWTDFRGDANCPGDYLLDYSADDGQNWTPVDSNSVSNACSYDWLVPAVDSNECLVRVSDANDATIYDTSDEVFTIYECTLNYDLNGDCFVDFLDLALLASEWLKCGNPFEANCL